MKKRAALPERKHPVTPKKKPQPGSKMVKRYLRIYCGTGEKSVVGGEKDGTFGRSKPPSLRSRRTDRAPLNRSCQE